MCTHSEQRQTKDGYSFCYQCHTYLGSCLATVDKMAAFGVRRGNPMRGGMPVSTAPTLRRNIKHTCKRCAKDFTGYPQQKFCTPHCQQRWHRNDHPVATKPPVNDRLPARTYEELVAEFTPRDLHEALRGQPSLLT